MHKAIDNFLYGLTVGLGFWLAHGLLVWIGSLIQKA